jgi:hypothetical protein
LYITYRVATPQHVTWPDHPAPDPFELSSSVSFEVLLVAVVTFVNLLLLLTALQVREVLEGYLDDDQDMKDMNLTAKEQHELQQAEAQVMLG